MATGAIAFQSAAGQAPSSSATYPLSMGYGPSVMTPLAHGSPIFTAGDQLWLTTQYQKQLSATLSSPNGTAVSVVTLTPMDPEFVYTFSGLDQPGQWTVTLSPTTQSVLGDVQEISFLVAQNDISPATLTSDSLSADGNLTTSFSMATTTQYDIQACAVGGEPQENASVAIPSNVGSGDLLLALSQSQLTIVPEGSVIAPFNYWVELYQNYSYWVGTPSTVISDSIEVASTTATSVAPPPAGGRLNSTESPLQLYAQMRTGRFTVRVFFDTPLGISVEQALVLVPGSGGWISLGGCSSLTTVASSAFTISTSLQDPPSTWPRVVYVMYQSEGVEMVSATDIGVKPAVVSVVATPWQTALTDSQLVFGTSPAAGGFVIGGDTLYLTSSQYPIQVGVLIPGAGEENATIQQPFTATQIQVNSSKLSVIGYLNGNPAAGVSVDVLMGNQTVARAITGPGFTVFYLPPGNFTVVTSFRNTTRAYDVLSQAGEPSVLSVDFTPPANHDLLYGLLASAVVGTVASVGVWVKVYRDRR